MPHQPRNKKWLGVSTTYTSGGSITVIGGSTTPVATVDLSGINAKIADLQAQIDALGDTYLSKVNDDTAAGSVKFSQNIYNDSILSSGYNNGKGFRIWQNGDNAYMKIGGLNSSTTSFTSVSESDSIDTDTSAGVITITKTFEFTPDNAASLLDFVCSYTSSGSNLTITGETVKVTYHPKGVADITTLDVTSPGVNTYEIALVYDDCIYTISYTINYQYGTATSSQIATLTPKIEGTDATNSKTATYGVTSYAQVSAQAVILMSGDNGIKVTPQEIDKTTDNGSTWTKLV